MCKMRTLEWNTKSEKLMLIDQRLLPGNLSILEIAGVQEVVEAIQSMAVRGAPAIGVTAAFGLALAGMRSTATTRKAFMADIEGAARELIQTRPTAKNLSWGIERILRKLNGMETSEIDDMRIAVLSEAQHIAEEDITINKRMAEIGADLIDDGDTIIHHCNTGALAAVDWGTALGVIRMAHEQGKRIHVLVDETRPRLQGARLTAWELEQYQIPYDLICDNAAGYFLKKGIVNKVFFGGDRVAENGDVANKVGTYMLALAAHANEVPVYCVVPTSTIDINIKDGSFIPIEERAQEEVLNLQIAGEPVHPKGARARNPAFDVTPHALLSAIVTEVGIVFPPFTEGLRKVVSQ